MMFGLFCWLCCLVMSTQTNNLSTTALSTTTNTDHSATNTRSLTQPSSTTIHTTTIHATTIQTTTTTPTTTTKPSKFILRRCLISTPGAPGTNTTSKAIYRMCHRTLIFNKAVPMMKGTCDAACVAERTILGGARLSEQQDNCTETDTGSEQGPTQSRLRVCTQANQCSYMSSANGCAARYICCCDDSDNCNQDEIALPAAVNSWGPGPWWKKQDMAVEKARASAEEPKVKARIRSRVSYCERQMQGSVRRRLLHTENKGRCDTDYAARLHNLTLPVHLATGQPVHETIVHLENTAVCISSNLTSDGRFECLAALDRHRYPTDVCLKLLQNVNVNRTNSHIWCWEGELLKTLYGQATHQKDHGSNTVYEHICCCDNYHCQQNQTKPVPYSQVNKWANLQPDMFNGLVRFPTRASASLNSTMQPETEYGFIWNDMLTLSVSVMSVVLSVLYGCWITYDAWSVQKQLQYEDNEAHGREALAMVSGPSTPSQSTAQGRTGTQAGTGSGSAESNKSTQNSITAKA